MRMYRAVVFLSFTFSTAAMAQNVSQWTWNEKLEIRANYRDSKEQKFALKFPFPPSFLPIGQKVGFLETVNSGQHAELSVVQLKLDLGYSSWFGAHTQFHLLDRYRANPTSEAPKMGADELWLRFGSKPEFLDRPDATSFFVQLGKSPKMERQPIRLLESYGMAATAFNRFEDVQVMAGGSVGRDLYWRLVGSTGNPLYFRDLNALASDNGIKELLEPNPDPRLKVGFPVLYNAEVQNYWLRTDHLQFGQGLGYRWQNAAQTGGFDLILFHYRRTMAQARHIDGSIYRGDIQLLLGPFAAIPLAVHGNRKEETGGRLYAEWLGSTTTLQYTKQLIAGLHREGAELETGYKFATPYGPMVGQDSFFQYIQPAARYSILINRFRGPKTFVDPSMFWGWTKIDFGVRIGLAKNVDVTAEYAKHHIEAPKKLRPNETLVTVRARI